MSKSTEFGGEEHFAAPPEKLYALLTDLGAMAGTIPDLVSSEKVDDRTLKCVVKPGFSFVRGTMKLTIALGECQPPQNAQMSVSAAGIGTSMNILSNLGISSDGGTGSILKWSATLAELKGLISAVPQALIRGAADQVIRDAWSKVRAQLGE